jgi:predicted esterase
MRGPGRLGSGSFLVQPIRTNGDSDATDMTRQFTQVVCDLIEEEAELLGGSEHVMLAGFSQGGALALHIAVHSGIQ